MNVSPPSSPPRRAKHHGRPASTILERPPPPGRDLTTTLGDLDLPGGDARPRDAPARRVAGFPGHKKGLQADHARPAASGDAGPSTSTSSSGTFNPSRDPSDESRLPKVRFWCFIKSFNTSRSRFTST